MGEEGDQERESNTKRQKKYIIKGKKARNSWINKKC